MCVGVAASTVTDRQVGMSLVGLLVGAGAVAATALYQVLPLSPPPKASPPSCSPGALLVADLVPLAGGSSHLIATVLL